MSTKTEQQELLTGKSIFIPKGISKNKSFFCNVSYDLASNRIIPNFNLKTKTNAKPTEFANANSNTIQVDTNDSKLYSEKAELEDYYPSAEDEELYVLSYTNKIDVIVYKEDWEKETSDIQNKSLEDVIKDYAVYICDNNKAH